MKKKVFATLFAVLCFMVSFGQSPTTEWKNLSYANDTNVWHKLDIRIPNTNKPSYKAVVIIYGSAWYGNNMKQMSFDIMGKPLLDAGFAVVTINHRSSMDAVYPAQINDVKAAVRFVRANSQKYNIDASFIGITGFSSGGHLASLAGASGGVKEFTFGQKTLDIEGNVGSHTDVSSSVDAVVDWFGPIDLALMDDCKRAKVGKSPEADIIRGEPSENPDMIALLSPITFLDDKDAPFLVIHGIADDVVPYCQSELFAKALKDKGLLVDIVSVPDGKHGPITFNDDTFAKMIDFFRQQAAKK